MFAFLLVKFPGLWYNIGNDISQIQEIAYER